MGTLIPVDVQPIVTGAQVNPGMTCDSCAALMVTLTIGGLHDTGVVTLPPILLCPDCYDPCQVVDEWREQIRGGQ